MALSNLTLFSGLPQTHWKTLKSELAPPLVAAGSEDKSLSRLFLVVVPRFFTELMVLPRLELSP